MTYDNCFQTREYPLAFPVNRVKLKARGGGGSRGQKIILFLFLFVVNSSRGGSCGTKISCQKDCFHPKIEVYICL